jgi:hypothetical protein
VPEKRIDASIHRRAAIQLERGILALRSREVAIASSVKVCLTSEPAHICAKRSALLCRTGADVWRSQMIAIGRMLSRAIITVNENEILKQILLLCAAGLFVSVLMMTYGVDLSPGFF